jgi:hypothetical protein
VDVERVAPTEEDEQWFQGPLVMETPMQVAEFMRDKWGECLANTSRGVVVFDVEQNIWHEQDSPMQVHAFSRLMAPYQHAVGDFFGWYDGSRKSILAVLKALRCALPYQRNWFEEAITLNYRKLAFFDGYWDFEEVRFVRGKWPGMRFLIAVPRNCPKKPPDDFRKHVFQTIFRRPFQSARVGMYLLKALACALAGEVQLKQAFHIIGPTNSGKSTLTAFLRLALGKDLVNEFNAENLFHNKVQEVERRLAWLGTLRGRIALSNEIDFKADNERTRRLSSQLYKKAVNGGRDTAPTRQVYERTKDHIVRCLLFFFSNDIVPFDCVDDAVESRARFLQVVAPAVGADNRPARWLYRTRGYEETASVHVRRFRITRGTS